jgi:peptidoglycan/LPS O-acetylase OafA/YrhL
MLSQTDLTTSQLPGGTAAACSDGAAAVPEGKRLQFIDNLRILLICWVLVVHLNATYEGLDAWYYHDLATNLLTGILLSILTLIVAACGIGFFFLLASYFTPGSYDRKGGAPFVRDRLVRLGLPLLLHELLIEPLAVYLAGGLDGSY